MSTDGIHLVCPHCHGINRAPRAKLEQGPKCGTCHRPLLSNEPLDVGALELERHVTKGDLPILVDFWAPWCGPCKSMAPVYAAAAGRYSAQARFAKLNTEEHGASAARYNIRTIPTLVLFHRGREVDRVAGALSSAQLDAWLAPRLART